ncbi:hypothetical protein RvY_16843 [Ramazzottius varieornatus]|uniref:Reverse transcriptase domain-containing protein n=1 Tax=Ramazzottius varieornatus TaxID=947166 RepID=A0A1D1W000_RAMVA|nr:hypothetical protein RvY_16843 [Ramazzottius varieornatus]
MLFCLAIETVTKKLTSPFNLWYLDDGTIGGDCSKVLADLCTVISEGMRIGLELNPSKCELFPEGGTAGERERIWRAFSLVCPEIIFPSHAELTLLVAPLLRRALEPAIEEKRSKFSVLTSRLNLLFSHQALFLLKNCLGLPKLLYVLRCSPSWKATAALQAFDDVLRRSVAEITNNSGR